MNRAPRVQAPSGIPRRRHPQGEREGGGGQLRRKDEADKDRERIQAFEGVCIARFGQGINESFTVRKISYGEGVERVFPVYSPLVDSCRWCARARFAVRSFITCVDAAANRPGSSSVRTKPKLAEA